MNPLSPERIEIKEFRELGYLQELNRQFLHPLGMAIEVVVDENGAEKLGGIWDYRDDPEGMFFFPVGGDDFRRKAAYVKARFNEKASVRIEKYGTCVQDPEDI